MSRSRARGSLGTGWVRCGGRAPALADCETRMLHIVFSIQEMLPGFSLHLCCCHAPASLSGHGREKTQGFFRGPKPRGSDQLKHPNPVPCSPGCSGPTSTGLSSRSRPCPLLHSSSAGGTGPRGTALPNPPGQCRRRAPCPSQCIHSWREEPCVTSLVYLPTLAPQKPPN